MRKVILFIFLSSFLYSCYLWEYYELIIDLSNNKGKIKLENIISVSDNTKENDFILPERAYNDLQNFLFEFQRDSLDLYPKINYTSTNNHKVKKRFKKLNASFEFTFDTLTFLNDTNFENKYSCLKRDEIIDHNGNEVLINNKTFIVWSKNIKEIRLRIKSIDLKKLEKGKEYLSLSQFYKQWKKYRKQN